MDPSPVSSPHSSEVSFERVNQYGSLDIETPITKKSELLCGNSQVLKKPRRQASCLNKRGAQNCVAQRAYQQRAAVHLKSVENELASLKQMYGEFKQRYNELNC